MNNSQELENAKGYDWIIIDDGPLKLKKQGYEPAITRIMKLRKTDAFKNTKFVIVVRPSLKEQIGITYKLSEDEIGDFNDIINHQIWSNTLLSLQL